MATNEWFAPLVFLISSVPASLVAYQLKQGNLGLFSGLDPERVVDKHGLSKRLSRYLSLLGMIVLAGGAGMAWAGNSDARTRIVVFTMIVLINIVIIALLVTVAAAKRAYARQAKHR